MPSCAGSAVRLVDHPNLKARALELRRRRRLVEPRHVRHVDLAGPVETVSLTVLALAKLGSRAWRLLDHRAGGLFGRHGHDGHGEARADRTARRQRIDRADDVRNARPRSTVGGFATSSATALPSTTSCPRPAIGRSTVPAGSDDVTCRTRASSPASRMAETASDARAPTTPGTSSSSAPGVVSRPSETTSATTVPFGRPIRGRGLPDSPRGAPRARFTGRAARPSRMREPSPRVPSSSGSVIALDADDLDLAAASHGGVVSLGGGDWFVLDRVAAAESPGRAQRPRPRRPRSPAIASISPAPALGRERASCRGAGDVATTSATTVSRRAPGSVRSVVCVTSVRGRPPATRRPA